MKIIGVIPARLGSTRLHEKVLKLIAGKPMIQHVWEKASKAARLDKVIVACDDARVADFVRSIGGHAVLTSPDHPNGSSRVAEVALKEPADIYINIQGDEPMIHPDSIDKLAECFEDKKIAVATIAVRKSDLEGYQNPNVVKVICDAAGDSIYFSRSPIPYFRDGLPKDFSYLKHLGIYGYQKDFLLKYVAWPPSVLENQEKLEQLRILERGYRIRVIETSHDTVSVDTIQDLQAVERVIQNKVHA